MPFFTRLTQHLRQPSLAIRPLSRRVRRPSVDSAVLSTHEQSLSTVVEYQDCRCLEPTLEARRFPRIVDSEGRPRPVDVDHAIIHRRCGPQICDEVVEIRALDLHG